MRIEPGPFMTGSEKVCLSDEPTDSKTHLRDGNWDEHPVHQVTLSTPFVSRQAILKIGASIVKCSVPMS